MLRFSLLMILGLIGSMSSMAQQERKFIREGNELFEKQDFEKAEVEYRKAADKKNGSFEAAFNMADALYKQKKYDEALQQFSALAKQEINKQRLGEIYHNIGNTLLAMEKTDESIEAYKESLRNRPDSEQTKYNLEFARNKQQQEQQNQDNKDQDKDQNKDQNKDQDKKDQEQDKKDQQDQNKDQDKDQNKDQDKKDQQDQNKDQNKDQQDQNKDQQDKDKKQDQKDQQGQNKDKNQQNKDQQNQDQKDQQQQQQHQEGKISKEDAERLLEALQNDEKSVQEKVQKQKAQEQKAKRMKIDKNW